MILIENTQIVGFEPAIRGMRNPMNSWEKSDTIFTCYEGYTEGYDICGKDGKGTPLHECGVDIGPNDHDLMMSLAKQGPVHGKYRRMIVVYVDITAPLYWWKQFDTYNVGTVTNSCSTMHKIHAKEFTLEDFSHEHLVSGWASKDRNGIPITIPGPYEKLASTIDLLNNIREMYLHVCNTPKDQIDWSCTPSLSAEDIWWQMIQLLPSSYNQKRTVMLNYEVLSNIYQHRRNHKLDEWREFCKWIETLPYSEIITCNAEVVDHD